VLGVGADDDSDLGRLLNHLRDFSQLAGMVRPSEGRGSEKETATEGERERGRGREG